MSDHFKYSDSGSYIYVYSLPPSLSLLDAKKLLVELEEAIKKLEWNEELQEFYKRRQALGVDETTR